MGQLTIAILLFGLLMLVFYTGGWLVQKLREKPMGATRWPCEFNPKVYVDQVPQYELRNRPEKFPEVPGRIWFSYQIRHQLLGQVMIGYLPLKSKAQMTEVANKLVKHFKTALREVGQE